MPISPEHRHVRKKNTDYRDDEHLTEEQVMQLADCAYERARGKNKVRDRLLILMAFYHGLRVSEVTGLKWSQIDLENKSVFVKRVKGSTDATHPLYKLELKLLSQIPEYDRNDYVFKTEAGEQVSTGTVRTMIKRTATVWGLPNDPHPHMLRHSCGYWLVNRDAGLRQIQQYMGHKNVQNTVRYTRLKRGVFNDFVDIDPFSVQD